MVKINTQPKETPSPDGRQSLIFGLYDRLADHGHCFADVVITPAKPDGTPDWENAGPANIEALPADEWPGDEGVALRAAVLVDHVDGCDEESSFIIRLDGETPELIQIHGPDADRPIAESIIARDIGAEPIAPRPSKLQESIAAFNKKAIKPAPVAANDNKSPFVNAQTLLAMEFEPVKYVIPGYIAEGLTILGGRPKLGKSWLALDFGVAVASGGRSLGVECGKGDALYLALEDNQRRLQDRLRTVLPPIKSMRPDLSRLSLLTEAPKIDAGLVGSLDTWRRGVENPRLIIIDTLAMVRSAKKRTQDSYEADYAALSPLQKWAGTHRLAVIVVTHVRKMESSDPLEMISGTNGLTGAADSILVLNRDADGSKLYGRGRDIEEIEKAVRFDGGKWSVLGEVDDVKRSGERREVLAALDDSLGPMTPAEIAKVIGKKVGNLNVLLGKMVKDGEVVKVSYGLYAHPGKTGKTDKSSSDSNHSNQSNVDIQSEDAA